MFPVSRMVIAVRIAVLLVALPSGLAARSVSIAARRLHWSPAHESGDGRRLSPASLEALGRLFETSAEEEDVGAEGDGAAGAADYDDLGGRVYFDDEDEAFLGVAAKLLDLLDEGSEEVGIEELSKIAAHEDYPVLANLVADLFAEADEDGDGRLSREEAEQFRALLRSYVADAMVDAGAAELDEALGNILQLIRDHPEGGLDLASIKDTAASGEDVELLLEMVEELFAESDADGDGVLNKEELDSFTSRLDNLMFASGVDGDSVSSEVSGAIGESVLEDSQDVVRY